MEEASLSVTSAASKALDVKGLTNKLLGPAFEEIGAMLADEVRIRMHLPRNIKLLQRVNQIVEEEKIKPKFVNLKVLLPLLNASALEDDETMADLWASLLASAADSKNESALELSFVEILKQLPPTHAFLLDVFYDRIEKMEIPVEKWNEDGIVLSELRDFLKKEVPQSDVAIQNLFRLRLVSFPSVKLGLANGEEVRVPVTSSNILCATSLGQTFVSACKRGREPGNMTYCVPVSSISNHYHTEGTSIRIWGKQEEVSWEKQYAEKYGKPANNEPL
jgi:hypothetical protein